jgi:CDP-diacylglycerol--glycerol-3-phosphate 3-phosphatidyltransferase
VGSLVTLIQRVVTVRREAAEADATAAEEAAEQHSSGATS